MDAERKLKTISAGIGSVAKGSTDAIINISLKTYQVFYHLAYLLIQI